MLNISKYCSIIDRCSSMYKNNSFKDIGICSSHAPFFFFLSKNPGATQDEISKRLVINKSNVTRSIQFLEEKGYVYREIDATDKRINHIYLSDDGVKLVPFIRERIYVFNEEERNNRCGNRKSGREDRFLHRRQEHHQGNLR